MKERKQEELDEQQLREVRGGFAASQAPGGEMPEADGRVMGSLDDDMRGEPDVPPKLGRADGPLDGGAR